MEEMARDERGGDPGGSGSSKESAMYEAVNDHCFRVCRDVDLACYVKVEPSILAALEKDKAIRSGSGKGMVVDSCDLETDVVLEQNRLLKNKVKTTTDTSCCDNTMKVQEGKDMLENFWRQRQQGRHAQTPPAQSAPGHNSPARPVRDIHRDRSMHIAVYSLPLVG